MKVNWSALGIMIAVLFLAVSVLTVGLLVGTKVSKLEQRLEQHSYCKNKHSTEYYCSRLRFF